VGVLCLKDGKPGVIEYSEIDKSLAQLRQQNGDLIYNAAHICMNMFSVEFLNKIVASKLSELPFHIAKKKIPAVNENGETVTPEDINGWKLELFIFDVFEYAERMVALEINRSEEFSPLKNAPGTSEDSPESCKRDISNLHKRFLSRSGGIINTADPEAIFEITPNISHNGKDLE